MQAEMAEMTKASWVNFTLIFLEQKRRTKTVYYSKTRCNFSRTVSAF